MKIFDAVVGGLLLLDELAKTLRSNRGASEATRLRRGNRELAIKMPGREPRLHWGLVELAEGSIKRCRRGGDVDMMLQIMTGLADVDVDSILRPLR